MTAQMVSRIDFKEINKVESTCARCGASIGWPVPAKDQAAYFSAPVNLRCLGCNTPLWSGENDQRLIRFVGLMRSLGLWQTIENPELNLSFSIITK
jgi:hypothetical protein